MHSGMTSRERVLCALAHEQVDRIPIDYMANAGIDQALKRRFRLAPGDDEGLLRTLQVDFREVKVPYIGPILHQPLPNREVDSQWGIVTRWIEHASGGYWDYCDFPLSGLDGETVESWPMPSPDDYDYISLQRHLAAWPEQALYVGNPGLADILNTTGMLCGMEAVYVALALEDPVWLRLVDRRLKVQLEVTERMLDTAQGRIDFLWIGEDLGAQNGPLISLDRYRRIIRPRHQLFVDLADSFGIPVMIHSCGSSSWAFGDFIDMGIRAVDTLQPEAANMDPVYLKREFGERLAFHGGFSTAGAIVCGSVEAVVKELKELLSIMMYNGGYLFSPTHMFQDNSSLENVLAVYRELPRMGKTPGWRR